MTMAAIGSPYTGAHVNPDTPSLSTDTPLTQAMTDANNNSPQRDAAGNTFTPSVTKIIQNHETGIDTLKIIETNKPGGPGHGSISDELKLLELEIEKGTFLRRQPDEYYTIVDPTEERCS